MDTVILHHQVPLWNVKNLHLKEYLAMHLKLNSDTVKVRHNIQIKRVKMFLKQRKLDLLKLTVLLLQILNQVSTKKEESIILNICPCFSDEIQIAGYLNLAADFFHNLTDGLAIGATFVRDPKFAIATTVTILLHEIPHEIGDFAILLQSGCSRKKAMYLQLITAFGAVLGTVISLIAEGTTETASTWILPFTAGGFIYIACVSVIPEILKETNFIQSVYEIIAAAIGVGTMILIAKAE